MYKPILGMQFEATVHQINFIMPQTGNERVVLSVTGTSQVFTATLSGISSSVGALMSKPEYINSINVWKGITGPEDSVFYTNYWLWVDPASFIGVQLQEGFSYNFMIAECSPFVCGGGIFSHGVNIKVLKLSP